MRQERGFSLVELMVAITLGLLLLAALVAVFVGSRTSYLTTTGGSSLDDDARFATDLMSRALRGSGFVACNEPVRITSNLSSTDPSLDFTDPVTGYEASGTNPGQSFTLTGAVDSTAADWSPNLPANGIQTLLGNVVKGSDVLVVHNSLTSIAPATVSTIANGATTFNVASSTGFAANQIAAISDCAKATVFQITALGGNVVTHASTGYNNSATFAINYSPVSFMYALTSSMFYIGLGVDGEPALYRGDLTLQAAGTYTMSANELVPDVETMQLLYGLDPGNQRTATVYTTANKVTTTCPTGTWSCVVSVSVSLLLASPTGVVTKGSSTFPALLGTTITPATTDTRQRQVYQFTVALRNNLP